MQLTLFSFLTCFAVGVYNNIWDEETSFISSIFLYKLRLNYEIFQNHKTEAPHKKLHSHKYPNKQIKNEQRCIFYKKITCGWRQTILSKVALSLILFSNFPAGRGYTMLIVSPANVYEPQ